VVNNPAKRLAGQMVGRVPVIYGAGAMAAVARRFRMQLAANAKTFALCDEQPDMDYGMMGGFAAMPESVRPAVICLAAPGHDSPETIARQAAARHTFMMDGIVPDTYTARGASLLAQVMSAAQFGDYMSFYLAMALGTDPTPTPALDSLFRRRSTNG
jgi:glucose/mannose-6-phosphate isomerase